MSRAFVRESDDDELLDAPARRHSEHPNYITESGERALRATIARLTTDRTVQVGSTDVSAKGLVRRLDAELEYRNERLRRAIVVTAPPAPWTHVRIGATVTFVNAAKESFEFTVVGEDEGDAAMGRISWTSPLGRALIGATIGECVTWPRADSTVNITVTAINYSCASPVANQTTSA
jgi:transcription elongation factor GreB